MLKYKIPHEKYVRIHIEVLDIVAEGINTPTEIARQLNSKRGNIWSFLQQFCTRGILQLKGERIGKKYSFTPSGIRLYNKVKHGSEFTYEQIEFIPNKIREFKENTTCGQKIALLLETRAYINQNEIPKESKSLLANFLYDVTFDSTEDPIVRANAIEFYKELWDNSFIHRDFEWMKFTVGRKTPLENLFTFIKKIPSLRDEAKEDINRQKWYNHRTFLDKSIPDIFFKVIGGRKVACW